MKNWIPSKVTTSIARLAHAPCKLFNFFSNRVSNASRASKAVSRPGRMRLIPPCRSIDLKELPRGRLSQVGRFRRNRRGPGRLGEAAPPITEALRGGSLSPCYAPPHFRDSPSASMLRTEILNPHLLSLLAR